MLGKRPTNTMGHFERKHSHTDASQIYDKKNTVDANMRTFFGINKPTKFKKGASQKKCVRVGVEWVAMNMRPIYILEDEGLMNLMQFAAPKFNTVSRKSILTALSQAEFKIDKEIAKNLNSIPFVAETTDGCSEKSGNSYCSLTIHYVNDSWQYKSHWLACSRSMTATQLKKCQRFLFLFAQSIN